MRVSILAGIVGVVALGFVWAPVVVNQGLGKLFPSNTPVAVVGTGELSKIVPSEHHYQYGALFRDFATGVDVSPEIQTTDQLLVSLQRAVKILRANEKIPENPAFNKAIDDKLTTVMTKKSEPLTNETRTKFSEFCLQVAADLGVQIQ